MNTRTYYVGLNVETNRLMIVVNLPISDIPFSVWRDVGQLAGSSISTPEKEVFEFLSNQPRRVERAEKALQGAMFTREV